MILLICFKLKGCEVKASGAHFKRKKDLASHHFPLLGESGMAL